MSCECSSTCAIGFGCPILLVLQIAVGNLCERYTETAGVLGGVLGKISLSSNKLFKCRQGLLSSIDLEIHFCQAMHGHASPMDILFTLTLRFKYLLEDPDCLVRATCILVSTGKTLH